MKEIKVNVSDSLIDSVHEVIEPLDMDIEMVIKMLLNRISRERNLGFLLPNAIRKEQSKSVYKDNLLVLKPNDGMVIENAVCDMRKSLAISIFKGKGIMFNGKITFASKNRTAYNYWANPPFSILEEQWFLILNDWINRVLYLFKIPSRSILEDDLIARADNNSQIDLQILYNDVNFRDTRSDFMFKQFLIMTERY